MLFMIPGEMQITADSLRVVLMSRLETCGASAVLALITVMYFRAGIYMSNQVAIIKALLI